MAHKTRRTGVVVGIAALVTASLAACSNSGDGETVTMWTFLNPDGSDPREQALAQIISNFEADHPEISIEVEQQVWDTMTPQFFAAASAGDAPDVVWLNLDQVGGLVGGGELADLNTLFIDDWSDDERADLDDAFWNLGGGNGDERYVIVHSRRYLGMLYSPPELQAAGIDPAELGTWDDLTAAATELTTASGDETVWGLGQQFAISRPEPNVMVPALLDSQGELFTADGSPQWATPDGVAALELQMSMLDPLQVTPPEAVTWSIEEMQEQFIAGRLAMYPGSNTRIPAIQNALGDGSVDLTTWPSWDGDGPAPGLASGWGVAVSADSPVLDAAGEWVEYMSSEAADKLWVEVGGQLPLRKSTTEALSDFLAQPENAYIARTADFINSDAYVVPLDYPTAGWITDLNQAAQNVWNGMEAEEALQQAEDAFTSRNS